MHKHESLAANPHLPPAAALERGLACRCGPWTCVDTTVSQVDVICRKRFPSSLLLVCDAHARA